MKEASFPALSPTSGFNPAPVLLPRHQPQPSLKGQFYFISSGGENSLCGLYPLSHTMPSPWLKSLSPLLTIHHHLSNLHSSSTPHVALSLASQDPKARSSAVGACAEDQAEGAEPSTCLLQF